SRAAADAATAIALIEESADTSPWNLGAPIVAAMVASPFNLPAFDEALGCYEQGGYRFWSLGLRVLAASRLLAAGQARKAQSLLEERVSPDLPPIDPCWGAEQFRVRAELL